MAQDNSIPLSAAPPPLRARRQRMVATFVRCSLGIAALGVSFLLGTAQQRVPTPTALPAAGIVHNPAAETPSTTRMETGGGDDQSRGGRASSASDSDSALVASTPFATGAEHTSNLEMGAHRTRQHQQSEEEPQQEASSPPHERAPPTPAPLVTEVEVSHAVDNSTDDRNLELAEATEIHAEMEKTTSKTSTTEELDWSALISQTLGPWSSPNGPGITEAQLDMAALAMHEVTLNPKP
jgi:hypothetical protein